MNYIKCINCLDIAPRMKYVICCPEGGLNDILCQIQKCISYCEKWNRKLIIDTNSSSSFRDDFKNYFKTNKTYIKFLNRKQICDQIIVNHSDVFPRLKIGEYAICIPQHDSNLNYNTNGVPLTFDFNHNYSESVLIHWQCGGGGDSKCFFGAFFLSNELCKVLFQRINKIPLNYTGFHFRSTDMQSDQDQAFFLMEKIRGPIFLASDSHSFIEKTRLKFGKMVFSLSSIPDFSGRPIHHECVHDDFKRQLNTDAILDMMLLSLSRKVFFVNPQSGFSQLAQTLNKSIDSSYFESLSFRLNLVLARKRIEHFIINR